MRQALHPACLPLSHSSFGGQKILLPQTGSTTTLHLEISPNSPLHSKPVSFKQVAVQPSPFLLLPSSQLSATSITPLPQTGFGLKQKEEMSPRHWQPFQILQFLQPSLFLLSHYSSFSTILFPHIEHEEDWPKIAEQVQPESSWQLVEQPILLPLSHCSPSSRIAFPQNG